MTILVSHFRTKNGGPLKTRSGVSRSPETMETEQSDHRGSISPNFEVNFVNGHGALEILVVLSPRSVLLIWFKGG